MKSIFALIKRNAQLGLVYSYYPVAAFVFRMLFGKQATKMEAQHHAHSSVRVGKRLEKGRESEGIDLWDLVLQQEDKGKGLSREEMDSNAGLFMTAGTETTATLLSGLTYLLLSNLESGSMKKLVDEVRGTFAAIEDISMEVTQGLPYLNACLKEALRLYPSVPTGFPHRTPKQGSTVCGYYVPPNVRSMTPSISLLSRRLTVSFTRRL